MNSVFFRLINTKKVSSLLAAGFCPKNLARMPMASSHINIIGLTSAWTLGAMDGRSGPLGVLLVSPTESWQRLYLAGAFPRSSCWEFPNSSEVIVGYFEGGETGLRKIRYFAVILWCIDVILLRFCWLLFLKRVKEQTWAWNRSENSPHITSAFMYCDFESKIQSSSG